MPVTVVVTYSCGGCSATATAPEQVIRSEFRSLSGQSHGIGRQRQEPPRIASLAPEGWVAFDPWTACTYCKDCWAAICAETGHEEVSG